MSPRVVDAISGPHIDTKFADAIANCLGIAQIAQSHRVQTRKNPSFGASVAQTNQPLCEELSLLNLKHSRIVSKRIRTVNDTTMWLRAA